MATKADIDKWIAAQGGTDAVVHGFDDIDVPDPRGERSHPDYDRAFKDKKISTRRETWTNKTTGAIYSAVRTPFADDQFQDIKETPGTKTATPAAQQKPPGGSEGPEGTPTGRKNPDGSDEYDNTRPVWVIRDKNGTVVWRRPLEKDERDRWERDKNGGKTDAEIGAPPDRVGKPTGNTRTKTENGRAVKETEYVLPDGSKEWRTQTEQGEPDRVGKPTGNVRTRTENGQQVKETEYILSDGSKEWRTQTATDSTKGLPKVPPHLRGWRPDPAKPGYGMFERRDQIMQAVSNGDISQEDGKALLEIDHQTTTSYETQINNERRDALTARSQDLTRNANAANTGLTGTNNALETWQKITAGATPGSGSIRDSLPGLLMLNRMGARQYGGDGPVTPYGPLGMGMGPGAVPPGMSPAPVPTGVAPPPGPPSLSAAMRPLLPPPPAVAGSMVPTDAPVFAGPDGRFQAPSIISPDPMPPDGIPGGGNVQMAGPGLQQRMAYDPSRVNQELLAAGLDPDVLAMFG